MTALEQLKLSRDPFGREAPPPIGQPVQVAFDIIARKIDAGASSLVMTGPPGSGKTFLLDMIDRLYSGRGGCVRRVTHGDLAHMALGARCDLLLVDEADSLDPATVQSLLSNASESSTGEDRPSAIVFACVSSVAAGQIARDNSNVIELALFAPADARNFLLERTSGAGRPDLFEPDAMDALIAGSGGSPQLLQSIGGHALFLASYDRSARIAAHHVGDALAAHIGLRAPKDKSAKPQLHPKDVSTAKPEWELDRIECPAATEEPIAPPPVFAIQRASRFRIVAAISIAAVVVLSLLSLNGSASVVRPLSANQASTVKSADRQLSKMESLEAMEKAARSLLPRPIVIAVIGSGTLDPVSIALPVKSKRPVGRRDVRQAAARNFSDR